VAQVVATWRTEAAQQPRGERLEEAAA